MRMRKKPNLGVRMERCTRVLISDPEEWKGKWRELMPEAKEVFLELGCGKGRFTAETAAQNPQALYIAVERVPDAMVIAMERVCAQELHNVFFVDGDVAQLPLFFAPGEVDRIYINFCDPWPSNRHAKRRLHADGIHGVMTDYEEKFHNLGTPINRCVGTMGPLPEVPEPPAEE